MSIFNSALMADEDFRADCASEKYADEPEQVRCVCGAVVNKDDATRAEDGESWLCEDCAAWVDEMNKGRIA